MFRLWGFESIRLWLWGIGFGALTLSLWFWNFYFEALAPRLWLWGSDSEALTLRLWLWGSDFEALTLRLWLWGFDFEALILRLWPWGSDFEALIMFQDDVYMASTASKPQNSSRFCRKTPVHMPSLFPENRTLGTSDLPMLRAQWNDADRKHNTREENTFKLDGIVPYLNQ